MSEITPTNETVVNKQMFVFDIKHNEYKSATLSKVAHADCFAEGYKCPANYTTSVSREIQDVPRATCEFCGGRLDAAQAVAEELALKKWIETGDKEDYLNIKVEQKKLAAKKTGSILSPDYKPEQVKTDFKQLGATTGRFSSNRPNLSASPKSNASDVLAQLNRKKGVAVTGVESSGVKIVTHQEQALSDMSKMSDEELFGKE